MTELQPWMNSLYDVPWLGRELTGLICVLVSALCGAAIGVERERSDKPAGLRTLMLIAIGTTIFTLVSLLVSSKVTADPGRIASQVLPGIGFLGAGAIIQARGTVLGLTTGATIWAVAAVGMTIGAGYVVAGVVFTMLILIVLVGLRWLERVVIGPCRFHRTTVEYRAEGGKSRARVADILERYRADGYETRPAAGGEHETLLTRICLKHAEHRRAMREIADLPEVVVLQVEGA